jgi:mannose-6-phosphate isomerase-like protein (cupin superfamily)
MMQIRKVNLHEMLGRFQEQWSPKIVGEVNDSLVKLVKLEGEFVWHHHDREDELFLVLKGRLRLQLHDQEIVLSPGEFAIIPHGVEHLPIADEETHVLLFEPNSTLNTGNIRNDRTVAELDRL